MTTFKSGIFVVETSDGDLFVGEIAQRGNELAIYTGFRGHPTVLNVLEVEKISFAENHPLAVVTYEEKR